MPRGRHLYVGDSTFRENMHVCTSRATVGYDMIFPIAIAVVLSKSRAEYTEYTTSHVALLVHFVLRIPCLLYCTMYVVGSMHIIYISSR
jgi:hypothetical protein